MSVQNTVGHILLERGQDSLLSPRRDLERETLLGTIRLTLTVLVHRHIPNDLVHLLLLSLNLLLTEDAFFFKFLFFLLHRFLI